MLLIAQAKFPVLPALCLFLATEHTTKKCKKQYTNAVVDVREIMKALVES